MAREHAATPRRKTGEEGEGKKARSSTTHTEGTNTSLGKSTATALALAGDSTPALTHTHTPSQCRQSAEEKIRPSTQQTHTPPAVIHQWTRTRSDTPPPPPPVQSHGQRDTATAPKANKYRTRNEKSPKEPHAEADPHPATTRRRSPRGHTERTVSSIELIRRPSLKDASVSDGPSNTIEENGQCGNAVTPPATMSPSYRGNSPITPRTHTQLTHYIKITQCFSPEAKQPRSLPNFFGHR
ncbi:hypothetical protein TcCL_Unassigned00893 [Trypanosoma cruzi]|nr:hypothetical protein TcCL_Unassigned00893 [Trypanosoma cruzi]